LWQPHSLAVHSVAARLRKPVVASAHGMLEKWELAHKAVRKGIYSALFERPALSQSTCLRALSIEEANDYRRYGLKRPIAVIPNGVKELHRVDTSGLTDRFPEIAGKHIVLYLGRINQKKGVLNLLESWAATVAGHRSAHLLIAGPEYADASVAARKIISKANISRSVTFAGTLSGSDKLAALSLARCFCLPSYSEGQSIAVLEALSIGLPVVITAACNVDGVGAAGAGLVVSNNPAELTLALLNILGMSSVSWQEMSNSARALAHTQFNWSNIGQKMQQVYKWMLGGPKPGYVID
jgi:glycosyltransferase involved in cell wall biosynthesis